MRIAIIDTNAGRAAVISDGLREAGLDDLVLIDPAGPVVAQIEVAKPEVVLINLENPSRDLLEDYFAMSRTLAITENRASCRQCEVCAPPLRA